MGNKKTVAKLATSFVGKRASDLAIDYKKQWCARFVQVCFQRENVSYAGVTSESGAVTMGGNSKRPGVGDTVLIRYNGAGHWGIVSASSSSNITVIEGNVPGVAGETPSGSTSVVNGRIYKIVYAYDPYGGKYLRRATSESPKANLSGNCYIQKYKVN